MKIIRLLKERFLNREVILYILFGVLTTAVDYVVFWAAGQVLGDGIIMVEAAAVLAWIAAVVFAFVTNKLLVFQSKGMDARTLFREAGSFTAARLFSLLVSMAFLYGAVEWLHWGKMGAKIVSSVFVVMINYIFSKLFIFKKKESGRKEDEADQKAESQLERQ